MSWADRIQRWRVDVKPGAPAAPSVAGDSTARARLQVEAADRRAISAPPSVPSSAGAHARKHAGRQVVVTSRTPISRAWERLRSPQASPSRSSGTQRSPPRGPYPGTHPLAGPPAMPLVAQPAFAITHVPYQAGPQVVVVPSPPAVPVPRPGHQAYYHQYQYRPHPAPTPYAVVNPAAVSLGTQICPACAAHVPTLDLTSHLRMHGWRV